MDPTRASRPAYTRTAIEAAGNRLAPSHARALALEADGATAPEMARVLDIPLEAVAPLLGVARAKLERLLRMGLVVLVAALAPQLGRGAVIEVTTLVDQDSGPACSLRNAIVAANLDTPSGGCPAGDGDDTIELGALSGILGLTSPLPPIDGNTLNGTTDTILIHGSGADRLEITGVGDHVVFTTAFLENVTIEGLTISEGLGTCLLAEGVVTVRDSRITRCAGSAIDDGLAGIRVTVERSLIDHNDGAAILVGGTAGSGGVVLVNSTVTSNGWGVAIESGEGPGALSRIYASTLADNASVNLSVAVDQRVQIDHTILHQTPRRGSTGVNCSLGGTQYLPPGTPNLQSNASLASDTSCGLVGSRDQEGVDPLLEALADNGGPTPTRALLAGSPAIDAGDTFCTGPEDALAVDQRGAGHPRPVATTPGAIPRCDVGAFEVPEPDARLAAYAAALAIACARRLRGGRARSPERGEVACRR
jgi:hypothetical protein